LSEYILCRFVGNCTGFGYHRLIIRHQSLTKFNPQGQIIEGTNIPKEVVEYLVIEKKKVGGVESLWHIWGTTAETIGTFTSL
jgi:hypothetical protein